MSSNPYSTRVYNNILKHKRIIKNVLIPVLFIGIFFVSAASSIERLANTTDEKFHLVRGIMLLETGDLRINQHHPFLFNLLPAIASKTSSDIEAPSTESKLWDDANKDALSVEMVEINGGREEFTLENLNPARISMIVLSSLFLLLIYFLSSKIFTPIPAAIMLAFLSTSPTLIAHSALVTTDVPAMFMIFITTLSYYWVMRNNRKSKIPFKYLIILLVLTTLMLLTKYTSVFITFILLGSLILHDLQLAHLSKEKLLRKAYVASRSFLIMGFGIVTLLWGAYQFQIAPMSEMAYANEKKIAADLDNLENIQEQYTFLGELPHKFYMDVPVPFPQYFAGFYSNVFKHNYYGHSSFFMGEFGNGGWLLYFPTAFLIKEPLGSLLLLLSGLGSGIILIVRNKPKIKLEHILIISVPLLLTLLSLMSSINLGLRHLLPIFPFIYLFAGIAIKGIINIRNFIYISTFIIILVFINIFALYKYNPYYLTYFNELVGGPSKGYQYVRDSNTDWGQSYLFTQDFIQQNMNLDITEDSTKYKKHDYLLISKNELYTSKNKISPEIEEIQRALDENNAEIVDEIAYTHLLIKFLE